MWKAHGLDKMEQAEATAFCERLFAKYLDGNALMTNAAHLRGSANWICFPRVICKRWVHWTGEVPVVLMGDAAHTAHFSIGSGTKLALEDAIELAQVFAAHGAADIRQTLDAYEAVSYTHLTAGRQSDARKINPQSLPVSRSAKSLADRTHPSRAFRRHRGTHEARAAFVD